LLGNRRELSELASLLGGWREQAESQYPTEKAKKDLDREGDAGHKAAGEGVLDYAENVAHLVLKMQDRFCFIFHHLSNRDASHICNDFSHDILIHI